MHRSAEQYDDAVATFRQIADLDPAWRPVPSPRLSTPTVSRRNYQQGAAGGGRRRQEVSGRPRPRCQCALRCSPRSDDRRSSAELKKLLDGKNDRETYITLAQVYEKAKNYTEMAKSIEQPTSCRTRKEDKESIAFMRGAMYEKMKKFDAAETEFRKVLELNPKNASALNYLGYMLADRNMRVNDALDYIKQALELDPDNGAYLDSLGWAYYRSGDLPKAEEYFGERSNSFQRIQRFTITGRCVLQAGKSERCDYAVADFAEGMGEFFSERARYN